MADDQVDLEVRDGCLFARPPEAIAGRLEARGVGIVTLPFETVAPVTLAVDLVAPDIVERMPDVSHCTYLGIETPLLVLAPFEASAPAKVRLAVLPPTRDISPPK